MPLLNRLTSGLWKEVTGDSYITWCQPVLGARGAAAYFSKYFEKDWENREELEARGFKRRYSCSRGWERDRFELKGMQDGTFQAGAWTKGREVDSLVVNQAPDDSLDVVGDVASMGRADRKRMKRELESSERFVRNDS